MREAKRAWARTEKPEFWDEIEAVRRGHVFIVEPVYFCQARAQSRRRCRHAGRDLRPGGLHRDFAACQLDTPVRVAAGSRRRAQVRHRSASRFRVISDFRPEYPPRFTPPPPGQDETAQPVVQPPTATGSRLSRAFPPGIGRSNRAAARNSTRNQPSPDARAAYTRPHVAAFEPNRRHNRLRRDGRVDHRRAAPRQARGARARSSAASRGRSVARSSTPVRRAHGGVEPGGRAARRTSSCCPSSRRR